jgi:hypothetical protein
MKTPNARSRPARPQSPATTRDSAAGVSRQQFHDMRKTCWTAPRSRAGARRRAWNGDIDRVLGRRFGADACRRRDAAAAGRSRIVRFRRTKRWLTGGGYTRPSCSRFAASRNALQHLHSLGWWRMTQDPPPAKRHPHLAITPLPVVARRVFKTQKSGQRRSGADCQGESL